MHRPGIYADPGRSVGRWRALASQRSLGPKDYVYGGGDTDDGIKADGNTKVDRETSIY